MFHICFWSSKLSSGLPLACSDAVYFMLSVILIGPTDVSYPVSSQLKFPIVVASRGEPYGNASIFSSFYLLRSSTMKQLVIRERVATTESMIYAIHAPYSSCLPIIAPIATVKIMPMKFPVDIMSPVEIVSATG